ncbi:MAG: conjugal transfer protein TraF [Geminicoccaceae bacterium]
MAQTPDGVRYFERAEEGWFWYEPEPELALEPPEPPLPEESEAAAEPPPEPPRVEAPPDTPKPLSAAWFRENLDRYRDQAIDDPTPENVEAYLYLQRIALERAGAFAEASAAAAVKDPWLDANSERPIATYAAQAMDAQAEAARETVLKEIAKEAGILFFYQDQCPLCDSQARVLKLANDVHGFEIVAVSLDGSAPKGGLTDYRDDDGQAARLGIAALPATFLVRPPDRIELLAQAPLDLQTLGRRIIGQAHALGIINEETVLTTKAVRKPFKLPQDLGDIPPDIMDDPAGLVSHIRQSIGTTEAGR